MVSFDLRRSLKYRSRDFFGAFMERSNEFFENSIEKVIESTFEWKCTCIGAAIQSFLMG